MSAAPIIFDRDLLRLRRERAAGAVGAAPDFLLERVAQDLIARLGLVKRDFQEVLDFGANHGLLGRAIVGSLAPRQLVSLETSEGMLATCPGERVLLEDEVIPFAEASHDLIVSGLALHFLNDLPGVLAQMRRVLKPDGLLLASMLGGSTLSELRDAWLVAEAEMLGGASPRVAPFADVRDMGGLLQRAGFALPVVDADVVRVTYSSPLALMAELKAMGASNILRERRRVPVTRGLLQRVAEIYQERFSEAGESQRVYATFEILTLTGWAPHESQPKPLKPGSATVRLADVLGVAEKKV